MRIRTSTGLCSLIAAAGLMTQLAAGQSNAPHRHAPRVVVTRLYTGADGQSHLDQVAIPLSGNADGSESSTPVPASDAFFVRATPGLFDNWHNADQKRYIVVVSGEAEVTTTDGEKTPIEPGHVYLAEDLTGKGHTFRVVGKKDWVALFVDLAR